MDATEALYLAMALAAVAGAVTGFFSLFGKGPRGSVLMLGACTFIAGMQLAHVLRNPEDGSLSQELDLVTNVLMLTGFFGALLGVWDMIQNRTPRSQPTESSWGSLVDLALRSPLVWGGVLCWAFYTAISQQWIDHPLVVRYLAGHPVEYITSTLFCVGLAALAMRMLHITGQFASQGNVSLPPIPVGGQPVSTCELLLAELARLPAHLQEGYLVGRLRDALEYVRRKNSADALDQHLRYLEEQDVDRMHSGYSLVRIVVWAIPILGFLGTVIGITMALANLSPQALEQSLSEVMAGLSVAFDTTAQALALSMVLMFLKYGVERTEERLLAAVDERVASELTGRFQFTGIEDDVHTATIRRMSEQVISAVEGLASRQAHIWKSSIDDTHQQWADVSASTAQIIKDSLSSTIRESLVEHADRLNAGVDRHADALNAHVDQHADRLTHNADQTVARLRQGLEKMAELLVDSLHQHGQAMTASEKELAAENRRHLSEVEAALGEAMVVAADRQEQLIGRSEVLLKDMQVALVEAADATVRQQEQLVRQGDVLLKVVDATGQVKQLEDTLNENLAALAQAQHFDELALNLTAAIQMLCARTGTLPTKPSTSDSTGNSPASHAA